ncbi:MAG: NAD(P)H-quinone oxidoreductase, partial [Roseomonas sp.]|nr:NAD(P)H-quinone oxidoreductase [Roseomonas sp.]
AFQRGGLYRPPAGTTDIPGVEFAGDVVANGPGTGRFRMGDRVCGITVGGGYAEYCAVPEVQLLPTPPGYDDVRAAGLAETFCTVWAAVWGQGRPQKGESILIHGGSSGIGTTAIMLWRHIIGGPIYATAGSAEKCRACEELGATRAINYRTEDFVDVVRQATGGSGVDMVLDMVAGDYVAKNISLLADDGRLVFVGRMSQQMEVGFHVQRIMYARLSITGVSLRGQSVARKGALVRQVEQHAWPLLLDGTIAPLIDTVFPLEEAAAAHRHLESSRHIGKIILRVAA